MFPNIFPFFFFVSEISCKFANAFARAAVMLSEESGADGRSTTY